MNEQALAIQDQYDEGFQLCYGCGSQNTSGLQLKSHRQGKLVIAEYVPSGDQLGVPGVVYGGLIASLIDCHGIATGAAHFQATEGGLPPRCVTASLHVEYRAPTPMNGQPLRLEASVSDASARKAVVQVRVLSGDQLTAEGQVIAVRMKPQAA